MSGNGHTGAIEVGKVIKFPRRRHARASSPTGYKSGRSSLRETPVSRSMVSTNSAGTPRLDRSSQYQTCDCVVPIRSAKGFCPPATSHARFSASVDDMNTTYPLLGRNQPRNLSGTNYLEFGKVGRMDSSIDPKAIGQRLRSRRNELGLSATAVGEPLRKRGLKGYSQQNIVSLEQGKIQDPRRQMMDLAEVMETTFDWLMYEKGPKETGPRLLTGSEFDQLPNDFRRAVTEMWTKRRPRSKSA